MFLAMKPVYLILLAAAALFFPGLAQSATTQWKDLGGGKVRMALVWNPQTNTIDGVIDVKLNPGWTTYWRHPGEAGIPPTFDFSKSQGVIVDQPDFPVPVAKIANGLTTIVYHDHVSFPFSAHPVITPMTGTLRLSLLMGVCEVICIPATADLALDLHKVSAADPIVASEIYQAKSKVPGFFDSGIKIKSALLDSGRKLNVSVEVPRGAKELLLFSETKPEWYLPPSKMVNKNGNHAVFGVDTTHLPNDVDLADKTLRFTVTSSIGAAERRIKIEKMP